MEDAGVGWIAAIIIGGIAGWLAEKVMSSSMGVLMNILLGIVGAIVANWILALLNIQPLAGWLGYLITGFVGACILIFVGRAIRR
ncbi:MULTISPECIES: GlsB/YeaQ/YmgE family stress response membrane protein [Rhizobium]|uniref:GlsB/YeaQ/YmgE family stress response membrane protein n=1 Tax=Rhizobium bangladeshense TaxID=1138189 RepID=A0ABS7LSF5_9HYPH|nr:MULTISPECIES: GlsB/YeaQ/YmgE family stress response membrane protein [Rhizobium]MBX4867950.1 GlsB/YeaQ/YmgE family stress response membrane protein [Rhizobium bangladeshense]MBX4875239.1 GlsB/YeaQ/YmgE family stress response membrane protein [Rhizobium bangladeshense]MBX4886152.1 GlsB/YeaQ/YmgE family stress response membrane protein [Rhizobium bangladeshense]MBX4889537.1 GlsB/YeaQ/YmgE family stress response membrane protein [Rhizobium bangladeshense]MBX4899188.1 GlsB/YeaQ/YmgE family stre